MVSAKTHVPDRVQTQSKQSQERFQTDKMSHKAYRQADRVQAESGQILDILDQVQTVSRKLGVGLSGVGPD